MTHVDFETCLCLPHLLFCLSCLLCCIQSYLFFASLVFYGGKNRRSRRRLALWFLPPFPQFPTASDLRECVPLRILAISRFLTMGKIPACLLVVLYIPSPRRGAGAPHRLSQNRFRRQNFKSRRNRWHGRKNAIS